MNLTNEFQPIRDWAITRKIIGANKLGDPKTQTIKLMEEVGELSSAVLKQNLPEVKDAIGDICVVLTSIASHHGFTIEQCINSAYNEIANRKGKIENGSFVKQPS